MLILLFIGLFAESVLAQDVIKPVVAENGMVATSEKHATQAGLEVLKEGGNAIDAAVTVGFTMAVTLPAAGNLGGGGFMVAYLVETDEVIAIDYREKAPMAATRDMFLDDEGNVDTEKSLYSYLAVGVPGTVAGLTMALEKYGTISLSRALKPAIELAEKGFPLDKYLCSSFKGSKKRFSASPASMAIFFKEGGIPYEEREILKQKDLAWSLKEIVKYGPDAFYKGEIAKRIAADMKANGGLITMEDLAAYRPFMRKPIHGTYRGYDIYSMPPPSSGGVVLMEMLNLLEPFPIGSLGHNTPRTIHLMVESMRLAYADRSKYLGDPDFSPVPIEGLISKSYADKLHLLINPEKAMPSNEIFPGEPQKYGGGDETTHFSVMDRYGNAVANTYTLNFGYGTRLTAAGTGILLNNEMDDFAAKPGTPNSYGLVQGEYNAVGPEKRMLSCMTPTIVMKDGKPFLVTGSPGGSRIITTVLQVVMNVLDHRMDIASAVGAVRIHHQWLPDEIRVERGLSEDTVHRLTERGHEVVPRGSMGDTESIMRVGDVFYGVSDPRSRRALTLGY